MYRIKGSWGKMVKITANEVMDMIEWLSDFSAEGEGVTRPLYTEEWVQAQKALEGQFEAIGLTAEYDAVGNLFGTIEGSEEPDSIIGSGSHIDTVVNGGRFDGQLGIVGAYLAVKKLIEEHGQPKKSLRVVSMAEEEGSRFPYAFWGSHNIFGIQDEESLKGATDNEGVSFEDAMEEAGFGFNTSGELQFNDYDAWIEIHAEQGLTLEKENLAVGIVNAIAGQKRYSVTLKGEANHAGTTLMDLRHDAVEGFSQIASDLINKAKEVGDPLVLTIGSVNVKPNVVNVVPGEVEFSIDTRHTDGDFLNEWADKIEAHMRKVADEFGLEIEIDNWMDEAPTPMDEDLVELAADVSDKLDLDYKVMHSGAGHDTQIFADYVPSTMIFVPSKDGISHNPKEWTDPEAAAQGVQALTETLYRLAY